MKLDVALGVPAALVAMAATAAVLVRATTSPPAPELRRASADEMRVVAALAAADEPGWANLSVQAFPEDHWSTRDDFHAREMKRIRELAGERGIPIEDVLRAIDDDLHRSRATVHSPDFRGARAVPCKPRPFYD